ncbi:hypothetical protein [Deinococcus apachensis]|uniref:hypothetical protein n=1 Tax=Deinococcus apachensis TaxID=309886 RepID=UPI0003805802|nr:hypothetical protein [Deinococcus apachensis]
MTEFVEGVREQRLVESLYRIATSEDPKMANAAAKAGEFLLKAWNREKWGDRQKIETTQTVNHMVQISLDVRDTFRAEQQAKLEALRARTLEG